MQTDVTVDVTVKIYGLSYYLLSFRCMYWLGGKLDVFYDRHDSFPNKNQVISFEFHHINSSCPLAEDFWQLEKFGKLDKRHVYLVSAVSNDPTHMDRLLDLINKQTNRQHLTFVIVDMGKDTEKYDLSKKKVLVDTEYIYLGGPFSRSIGLKRGFDYAKQLAVSRGHTDAIGFSIDTSIIIPKNFSDTIRSHVRCGLSSFAPVCYKHKDPGGYWVTTGYVCIVCIYSHKFTIACLYGCVSTYQTWISRNLIDDIA